MTSNSFTPTLIPGLPSPYDEVNGLVYFPRMVAKMRLAAEGALPESHLDNLGGGFDGRCVRFLGVDYETLKAKVLAGPASDAELLEWCFEQGCPRNAEEIETWSGFLKKRGWRDASRSILEKRIRESRLPEDGAIQTMFDYIDTDEGRPLREQ